MKQLIFTLTSLFLGTAAFTQDTIIQVDQGAGYKQSVFLNLEDQQTTIVDYTTWDIAFGTANRSATILYNEAAVSGENSNPLELYVTSSTDFEAADTTLITDTLYNGDSALTDGAFGMAADTSNGLDFGWGMYDINTHNLNGTRIFILKLRDNTYKKIRIDQMQSRNNKFLFTYGDLDNENIVTDSIDMNDYDGKTLAYYSLKDQQALDLEPQEWDLKFTRYNTPVATDEVPEGFLNYQVTGVLSRPGVEVAVASEIDPSTVEFEDFAENLTDAMDAIGYDWKYFDLNTFQYSVIEDEVFFVKTPDNEVYKLQFLDFEGTSTGVTTIQITFEQVISSLVTAPDYITATTLFPNPVTGSEAQIRFHSEEFKRDARLLVNNSIGQEVFNQKINILQGENTYALPVLTTPGIYYVILRTEDGITSLPLINN